MEAFLKSVKFIEKKQRYTITGFVREIQSQLPKDNYYIIPSLVIYTILYYYHENEGFHPDNHGTKVLVNETHDTVLFRSHITTDWHSAYGKKLITNDNKTIYEWKMIITYDKPPGGIAHALIGIHSFENCKMILEGDFTVATPHYDESSKYWGICDNGKKYSNAEKNGEYFGDREWKTEDILKMTLNMKDKTMSFSHNNKDHGIAFKDMSFYKNTYMAVASGYLNVSFQLLSFSATHS